MEKSEFILIPTLNLQALSKQAEQNHEYVIPIKCSSLKAIYFYFTKAQTQTGIDSFTNAAENTPANNMRTTFFSNGLESYQFFIDGVPTPASPVLLNYGPSEGIAELSRSLHFGHKTADGSYLSLLAPNYIDEYYQRNCIFGQEFESFSQKGGVIESGMNTQGSNVSLRLSFGSGTSEAANLRVFCMYDVFLAMSPGDGDVRIEN